MTSAPLPVVGELEPLAVTIEQAARALQTSPDTIRRMIRSGELPAYKLRAQWRIRVDVLREFGAAKGLTTPAPKRTPAKRTPAKRAGATVTKLPARRAKTPRKATTKATTRKRR